MELSAKIYTFARPISTNKIKMTIKKNLVLPFLALILALLPSMSMAQDSNPSNLTSSPYTRYGFGKLGSVGNASTRGMGDIGIALRTNRYTNLYNPASLTAIDTLTMLFDTALEAEWFAMSENGTREQNWNAGFSYLSMHFPLWNRFAGSIAYTPYSLVGYEYGNQSSTPIDNALIKTDTLVYSNTYSGSGGLQHFTLSVGWNPIKTRKVQLNLGVTAGYIAGSVDHTGYMLVSSGQGSSTYVGRGYSCSGYDLLFGAQYSQLLAPAKQLTIGATFAPSTSIHCNSQVVKFSGTDTIGEHVTNRLKLAAPMKVGFGVAYQQDRRLTMSAEYTFENWKKVDGLGVNMTVSDQTYQNVNRIAAGVEYRPSLYGRGYFKNCLYRAGLSVKNSYINSLGDQSEYTATCGIGMPIRRSSFNFAVSYTYLKPEHNTLLKEQYLHLTLGITFNEMMFYRNKLR